MLGVFYYLLHTMIVRNIIFLTIFATVLYFSSDYEIITQLTPGNINDLENIILEYLHSSSVPYFYTVAIAILITINMMLFVECIFFYTEISLPYSLNLSHKVKNLNKENGNITILDRFSFIKYLINNASKITIKNKISIDKKRYEDAIEQIREFLRVPKDSEVLLKQTSKKSIDIEISHIPKYIELDTDKIIQDEMYLGVGFNGKDIYVPYSQLSHTITSAASGSGKSVLLNLKMLSHLKNIDSIDKIICCDFKGGVELNRYADINEKITFIDTKDEFIQILEELVAIMDERYKYLKANNQLKYKEQFIFLIIDEFGTIASFEKKDKEHIFKLLTLLLQKGRACNLLSDFYLQKFDASSIPTQISVNLTSTTLMRSQSDYANQQLVGVQDDIKKITNLEPSEFPIGRCIYKNGLTSEFTLLQVPFFPMDTYKSFL